MQMRVGILSAALTLALMAAGPLYAQAQPQGAKAWVSQIKTYDRAAWSRTPTDCDARAAHPDDPEKVAPGVAQAAMDIPAAIAACVEAVGADAGNPRLNYQLARAYGYAGRHAEGAPYRQAALMAGYPQSLFVVGFIMITGWGGAEKDACTAAALVRLSAIAGRKAGLFGYPHYVVNGAFAGCAPAPDKAEMLGFLGQARPLASGYYEQLLLENLTARVQALP
jgi:hypothetical protein